MKVQETFFFLSFCSAGAGLGAGVGKGFSQASTVAFLLTPDSEVRFLRLGLNSLES